MPEIPLEPIELEMELDTPSAWNMEAFYDTNQSKQISYYTSTNSGLCTVQNPYINTKFFYEYEDNDNISDFSIAGSKLFLLTSTKLKVLNIHFAFGMEIFTTSANVAEVKDFVGIYIHSFQLSNQTNLVLFQNANLSFFYSIVNNNDNESIWLEILPLEGSFFNFHGDMGMAMTGDYLFISVGLSGVYVYHYIQDTQELVYVKTILDTYIADARDVAAKLVANESKMIVLVADYKLGLVVMDLDDKSLDIKRFVQKKEFVKAKSLSLHLTDPTNILLLILDLWGGSSKFATFRIDFTENIMMIYDQVRLLDGIALFGGSTSDFASIIMSNSVMLIPLNQRNDQMTAYLNSFDKVINTRIVKVEEPRGDVLAYNTEKTVKLNHVVSTTGFLFCRGTNVGGEYSFTLKGMAQNCVNQTVTIGDCYYTVDVKINVVDREKLEYFKILGIIVLVIIGVLVVAIIVLVFILTRKYLSARRSLLDFEKTPLTTKTTESAPDPSPTSERMKK